MYIPGLATFLDLFRIHYVVPHEPQNLADASPFQGFTPGILDSAQVFRRIALLPRDIAELVSSRDSLLQQRIFRSGYSVFPMQIEVLQPFLEKAQPEFCCVWSTTSGLAEQAKPIVENWGHPILHLTPAGTAFGTADTEVTREVLRDYAIRVLEHWERTGQMPEAAQSLRSSIDSPDSWDPVKIGLHRSNHLVTVPNEVALISSGCELAPTGEEPLIGTENQPYLRSIHKSVLAVRTERERILSKRPHLRGVVPYDTILTAPSMFKEFDAYKRHISRDLPTHTRKILLELLRQLALRGTYNFVEPGEGNLARAFASPEGQALIRIRQEELFTYTATLALRASSNLVPVIRLPPSVNLVRQELTQLSNCARSGSPAAKRKLSDLARKLSEKLAAGIPDWIVDEIRNSTAVKLVSDAPLEWLPVDGLPLALRVDCTRIPTTPGNLFLQNMVGIPEIPLTTKDFDEVLVIRAFAPSDSLRHKVTQAIEITTATMTRRTPRIRFVDVVTKDDLVRALNEFAGALMIYDGHGVHRSDSDVGKLRLPAGEISAWEIRGHARIPPIVVLSACDTHPFDASHVTTANALLGAGAETVLATALPVNANHAAVFIGRLLLRMGEYMPLLLRRPQRSLRWSEILPGLQRRQYCTEALLAIDGKHGIKLGDRGRLQVNYDVGMEIDGGNPRWFETMIERASEEGSVSPDQIRNAVRREAFLTDALLYVQLGNPERLVVFQGRSL